jgi:hypothetical protein
MQLSYLLAQVATLPSVSNNRTGSLVYLGTVVNTVELYKIA